jgi:hypothetical protein
VAGVWKAPDALARSTRLLAGPAPNTLARSIRPRAGSAPDALARNVSGRDEGGCAVPGKLVRCAGRGTVLARPGAPDVLARRTRLVPGSEDGGALCMLVYGKGLVAGPRSAADMVTRSLRFGLAGWVPGLPGPMLASGIPPGEDMRLPKDTTPTEEGGASCTYKEWQKCNM